MQVNGGRQLYSRHPGTGKVYALSVFHLPEGSKSQEISLYREFLNAHQDFITGWQARNPYKGANSNEQNAKFKKEYTGFLQFVREKYNLTGKDIKFWLTF